jgi:methylmalonyl-CoA mutase, N-terminal domain
MKQKRTTKQILDEQFYKEERFPLYNHDTLNKLQHDLEEWKRTKISEQNRKNWAVVTHSILGSEMPREMLYTPLNNPDMDYTNDLGFSGQEPYTRGIHASMYRGRMFTIRQLPGAGSTEQMNKRIQELLTYGATGINLILDLPTIQMYDSDEPEAKGQVGRVGVPIDCAKDMEIIFNDIPIEKISTSLVTHYPTNTAILFSMYLVMAERKGIPWDTLQGSVQNDFIMETVVRSAKRYLQPDDVFKIQCDNIAFIRKNVPQWNCITFNGYNLREFGTSGITEMAVATANAIATLEAMENQGYNIDWIGERLAFFWSFSNDFFEEIARLRAMRRLWYRIMHYKFHAKNLRSTWMRCHVQTSGISLTKEEPLNNIVRASYQALAAILGGAQSLHVDSYDEAYSVPSEETSLLSIRTQQIIQEETCITQVVDPLGGSFYLEALTSEIERKILDELDEIERMGGIVVATEKGWLHNKIYNNIKHEQEMIATGEIKVVGRNLFQAADLKMQEIQLHKHNQNTEKLNCEKLKTIRQNRDNNKVNHCINELKEACRKGNNIMANCIEAARADVTIGEMRQAFEEASEGWIPPRYV